MLVKFLPKVRAMQRKRPDRSAVFQQLAKKHPVYAILAMFVDGLPDWVPSVAGVIGRVIAVSVAATPVVALLVSR